MIFLQPISVSKDKRRTLKNLFRTTIKDVNYYEAKKGCVLGGHYHKRTHEYFYILSGRCAFTSDSATHIVQKGEIFYIPPYTVHSLKCLTNIKFMTFLTEPYNAAKPDLFE